LEDKPHGHGFTKLGNGNPVGRIRTKRDNVELGSGVQGCTFMKTTGSAWVDCAKDEATTLPETGDRICAGASTLSGGIHSNRGDFSNANPARLQAMLKEFATTCSEGVQDRCIEWTSERRAGQIGCSVGRS
jgi:urate oxidase